MVSRNPSCFTPNGNWCSHAAHVALSPRPTARLAWLLLVITITNTQQPVAASDWQPIPSGKIAQTFGGRELADGVHFAYSFHRAGQFNGVEMGRDVNGRWRVDGDELCWTWIKPRGAEECMTVRRRGHDVQLMRDGALFLEGTLSK